MIFEMVLIILLLTDNAYSGNEDSEMADISMSTASEADLASNSLYSKTPEEELEDVTQMLKLPESTHQVVLGNIERVPAETKAKIFEFYNCCKNTPLNLKSIYKLEWNVMRGIFKWKSSKERDSKILMTELENSIQYCTKNSQNPAGRGRGTTGKIGLRINEPTNIESDTAEVIALRTSKVGNQGGASVTEPIKIEGDTAQVGSAETSRAAIDTTETINIEPGPVGITAAGTSTPPTSSTKTKRPSKIFNTNPIADIDQSCTNELTKASLRKQLGDKEEFLPILPVIQRLPKAACGRIALIHVCLERIRHISLSVYQKFARNVEKQAIRAIRIFLNKSGKDGGKRDLFKALRSIFLRFTNWFEKLFKDKVSVGHTIKREYTYTPRPGKKNLPDVKTLLQFIPPVEQHLYDGNWNILTIILNLPVSIHPVIIGNIHFIPYSTLIKFLNSIQYCIRESSPKIYYSIKVQSRIIFVVKRWKSILNNLSKPPSLPEKDDDDLMCESVCTYKTVLSTPNYTRIGDTIDCPNDKRFARITGELDTLNKVISSLPAETCGWASVIRLMIGHLADVNKRQQMETDLHDSLQTFSSNRKKDKQLHITLMDTFNELTSIIENQYNEGLELHAKKAIPRSGDKSASAPTKSGSKRRIKYTNPAFERPSKSLQTTTDSSLSELLNRKVILPIDWSEIAFLDRILNTSKAKTDKTEKGKGNNEDSQIEKAEAERPREKEDISKYKDLLDIAELNSELTLE